MTTKWNGNYANKKNNMPWNGTARDNRRDEAKGPPKSRLMSTGAMEAPLTAIERNLLAPFRQLGLECPKDVQVFLDSVVFGKGWRLLPEMEPEEATNLLNSFAEAVVAGIEETVANLKKNETKRSFTRSKEILHIATSDDPDDLTADANGHFTTPVKKTPAPKTKNQNPKQQTSPYIDGGVEHGTWLAMCYYGYFLAPRPKRPRLQKIFRDFSHTINTRDETTTPEPDVPDLMNCWKQMRTALKRSYKTVEKLRQHLNSIICTPRAHGSCIQDWLETVQNDMHAFTEKTQLIVPDAPRVNSDTCTDLSIPFTLAMDYALKEEKMFFAKKGTKTISAALETLDPENIADPAPTKVTEAAFSMGKLLDENQGKTPWLLATPRKHNQPLQNQEEAHVVLGKRKKVAFQFKEPPPKLTNTSKPPQRPPAAKPKPWSGATDAFHKDEKQQRCRWHFRLGSYADKTTDCRFGDNCKWSHDATSTAAPATERANNKRQRSDGSYCLEEQVYVISDVNACDKFTFAAMNVHASSSKKKRQHEPAVKTAIDNCSALSLIGLTFAKALQLKEIGTISIKTVSGVLSNAPLFQVWVEGAGKHLHKIEVAGVDERSLPAGLRKGTTQCLLSLKHLHKMKVDLNEIVYQQSNVNQPIGQLPFLLEEADEEDGTHVLTDWEPDLFREEESSCLTIMDAWELQPRRDHHPKRFHNRKPPVYNRPQPRPGPPEFLNKAAGIGTAIIAALVLLVWLSAYGGGGVTAQPWPCAAAQEDLHPTRLFRFNNTRAASYSTYGGSSSSRADSDAGEGAPTRQTPNPPGKRRAATTQPNHEFHYSNYSSRLDVQSLLGPSNFIQAIDKNDAKTTKQSVATFALRPTDQADLTPVNSLVWSHGQVRAQALLAKLTSEQAEDALLVGRNNVVEPAYGVEEVHISEAKLRIIVEKRKQYAENNSKRARTSKDIIPETKPMEREETRAAVFKGINSQLTGAETEATKVMLDRLLMCDVFSDNPGRLNKVKPVTVRWKSDKTKYKRGPPKSAKCPKWGEVTAEVLRTWANKQVELGLGVLKPQRALRYANRPLIVCPSMEAENPKLRIATDCRETNDYEEDGLNKLPDAAVIRSKVAGSTLMTTIDITRAFEQVTLDNEAAELYAVWTPDGILVPTTMIFGGKSFPIVFQTLMEDILREFPEFGETLFVYVDDVIICAKDDTSLLQHLDLVERVCMTLHNRGLTLSPKKMKTAMYEAQVLGHRLSRDGDRPSEEHVVKLSRMKLPMNAKEVAADLGFLQYYCKHASDYSAKARLIGDLKAGLPQRQDALDALIKDITNTMLVPFDPNQQLILDVDANDDRCGGVLSHIYDWHIDDDGKMVGKERPIMFFSYVFNETQRKWVIYVREAFGLVFGLDKCRQFIDASITPVRIRTDHRPLLWLQHARSPMVVRWLLEFVQDAEFSIEYRPGPQHGNADGMTRIDLISPGTPTRGGRLQAVDALLRNGYLKNSSFDNCNDILKKTTRPMLIHAQGHEKEVLSTMREFNLVPKKTVSAKPSETLVKSSAFGYALLLPTAEVGPTMANLLLDSERPFAILLPSDLVHLIRRSSDLAKQRWITARFLVFLEDNLTWMVVDPSLLELQHGVVYAMMEDEPEGVHFLHDEIEGPDRPLPPIALTSEAVKRHQSLMDPADRSKLLTKEGMMVNKQGVIVRRLRDGRSATTQLYIPPAIRPYLMRRIHLHMKHPGVDRMLNHVADRFWWDSMSADVHEYTHECVFCALAKAKRSMKALRYVPRTATKPSEQICWDWWGPVTPDEEGNTHILTMVDMFNDFTMFIPAQNQDANTTAALLLQHQVWRRGTPQILLSDASPVLAGQVLTTLANELDIEIMIAAAYSPWMVGKAERRHQVLGKLFLGFSAEERKTWGAQMAEFSFVENQMLNQDSKLSANELEYGRALTSPIDAILDAMMRDDPVAIAKESRPPAEQALLKVKQVRLAQRYAAVVKEVQRTRQRRIERQNGDKTGVEFKQGDRVVIRRSRYKKGISKKLLLQWEGPFVVQSRKANNLYLLKHEFKKDAAGNDVETQASGMNMSTFKPSAAMAEAFFKDNAKAPQIGNVVEVEDLIEELELGTIVAFRHDAIVSGVKRFWLGKIVSIDTDNEVVTLQYLATKTKEHSKFTMVWLDTKDDGRPVLRDKKPQGARYEPWICQIDMPTLIVAGLELRKDGQLDKDSKACLPDWTPMIMKGKGFQ